MNRHVSGIRPGPATPSAGCGGMAPLATTAALVFPLVVLLLSTTTLLPIAANADLATVRNAGKAERSGQSRGRARQGEGGFVFVSWGRVRHAWKIASRCHG